VLKFAVYVIAATQWVIVVTHYPQAYATVLRADSVALAKEPLRLQSAFLQSFSLSVTYKCLYLHMISVYPQKNVAVTQKTPAMHLNELTSLLTNSSRPTLKTMIAAHHLTLMVIVAAVVKSEYYIKNRSQMDNLTPVLLSLKQLAIYHDIKFL
jgi:hypothetical protein